jgi:CRP-like cAMP-binding protein
MPGNQIFKEGERGDKLYFINKGSVVVSIAHKSVKTDQMNAMREKESFL